MISGYNSGHISNLKNIFQVIPRQISLHGFYIAYLEDKYRDEFFAFAEPKVANGEIKYDMDVYDGLEKVPETVSAVLKGLIKAKAVVHVADA
jgi:NADPH-dependent curcumin reductase CurA